MGLGVRVRHLLGLHVHCHIEGVQVKLRIRFVDLGLGENDCWLDLGLEDWGRLLLLGLSPVPVCLVGLGSGVLGSYIELP